MTVDKQPS